jgi:hypothetical protein
MAIVKGPDFIALQVPDFEKLAKFYSEVLGLPRAPKSPPDGVLFLTTPISFAVRKPHQPLEKWPLGYGAALWFLCDNSIELYARLKNHQFGTTHWKRDGCVGLCESACSLDTNTGCAARDDGVFPGQIDAFDDIQSCRVKSERCSKLCHDGLSPIRPNISLSCER